MSIELPGTSCMKALGNCNNYNLFFVHLLTVDVFSKDEWIGAIMSFEQIKLMDLAGLWYFEKKTKHEIILTI